MGNISSDPKLLLPEFGEFHLRADSPCIDAGCLISTLIKDFEGDARGYNGTPEPRGDGSDYDIGADEYNGSVPPTPTPTPIPTPTTTPIPGEYPTTPTLRITFAVDLVTSSVAPWGGTVKYRIEWDCDDKMITPIIHDDVAMPISPEHILDILRKSEILKVGQKWTVIVTPKADGIKGYPAKLEFRIGWNGAYWVIW